MLKAPAKPMAALNRRRFLRATAACAGVAASLGKSSWAAATEEFLTMPFENGRRPLVQYPQKRPLIRLTTRPPQLETPFSVFNEGVLTPNDAFFVRYHLAFDPFTVELDRFRLRINGKVTTVSEYSISEL